MRVVYMSLKSRRRIIESSIHTLSPVEINGRQEIGLMRAQMESAKFQVIQWLVTIAMSAGALGLGIFSFVMVGLMVAYVRLFS
jgi:hypothetical protein